MSKSLKLFYIKPLKETKVKENKKEMIRRCSFSYVLLLFTCISYGQSIIISLPENLAIETVPSKWKGHNHGANANVSESETAEFIEAFSKMNPGIIRWPGGNSGNNYRWI